MVSRTTLHCYLGDQSHRWQRSETLSLLLEYEDRGRPASWTSGNFFDPAQGKPTHKGMWNLRLNHVNYGALVSSAFPEKALTEYFEAHVGTLGALVLATEFQACCEKALATIPAGQLAELTPLDIFELNHQLYLLSQPLTLP